MTKPAHAPHSNPKNRSITYHKHEDGHISMMIHNIPRAFGITLINIGCVWATGIAVKDFFTDMVQDIQDIREILDQDKPVPMEIKNEFLQHQQMLRQSGQKQEQVVSSPQPVI